jgi:hypothetical protein
MESMEIKAYELNGKTFVNVTPYPISFMINESPKKPKTILPSGIKIHVLREEPAVYEKDGAKFCNLQFVGTRGGNAILAEIKKQYPDAIIIGSLMAAQAYPGDIVALCPAEGYERVAASERLYRVDRFIVF